MESFFTCRKIQEVCGVKVRNGVMCVIWWACAEIVGDTFEKLVI